MFGRFGKTCQTDRKKPNWLNILIYTYTFYLYLYIYQIVFFPRKPRLRLTLHFPSSFSPFFFQFFFSQPPPQIRSSPFSSASGHRGFGAVGQQTKRLSHLVGGKEQRSRFSPLSSIRLLWAQVRLRATNEGPRQHREMNEAKVTQRYILDLPFDFGKIQFFLEVVTRDACADEGLGK